MKKIASVSVMVFLLACFAVAPAQAGSPLVVVGLTADQRLVSFRVNNPGTVRTIGTIFGLSGDIQIVGIDFRPATGDLYGLGEAGGVYTLDLTTAQATFKARLNAALTGTSFGVDFNPTADRLRIISDIGQNLRANVDDGSTTLDLTLNYTGPAALGVTGAAYTNNDLDPNTATTLFDIDSVLDQVVVQAPPNNGSLNPSGKLLVDAGSPVGFDIYSRLWQGRSVAALGFASLSVGGRAGFFTINLLAGEATLRGWFPVTDQVVDVALPLGQ